MVLILTHTCDSILHVLFTVFLYIRVFLYFPLNKVLQTMHRFVSFPTQCVNQSDIAKKKRKTETNPAERALLISFWSVPAKVFLLLDLGLLERVLRRKVLPSDGCGKTPGCNKDFLCTDILSKLLPEMSTATISAGNLKIQNKHIISRENCEVLNCVKIRLKSNCIFVNQFA